MERSTLMLDRPSLADLRSAYYISPSSARRATLAYSISPSSTRRATLAHTLLAWRFAGLRSGCYVWSWVIMARDVEVEAVCGALSQ